MKGCSIFLQYVENVKLSVFPIMRKGQPLQLILRLLFFSKSLGLLYKWILKKELKWKITVIPELTGKRYLFLLMRNSWLLDQELKLLYGLFDFDGLLVSPTRNRHRSKSVVGIYCKKKSLASVCMQM